jgi:ABC-type transport system involved in multi-copper enzyme maturation permease subunit
MSNSKTSRELRIQTWAIVVDTFREAMARKIIWGFFGCSTALILFFLLLVKIDVVQGALATMSLFGKTGPAQDISKMVPAVHAVISNLLYGFGMILAILASAGLIPSVFEPGRIELLLSKPVSRTHLLLGRYLGNLLVIAANIFYPVIAVWLIFGIKTGVWTPGFLYSSILTVFMFGVYLSVIVLVGVQWESAVVATMITFALIVISIILNFQSTLERLLSSEWSRDVVRALYYILPKGVGVGQMMTNIIKGQPIESWMPFWTTALFGAVCLGAGLYIFEKKNY